ncbi:flagellar basal body rod protein FlgB [Rariglobus hedericola]|uniref:Flagellar basal body rod protein FlgB n=2 Tax=Rariglobus hedericola TaxID=2597822 RepID=A0A556QSV5_9BACT|nr:flagellar basal body rod protein FlgB [Rariglobus hedericola]
MVDPIFQSPNYQLASKLLDVSVLRQEAIASNIANSETPGYRRIDVAPDFATELRSRINAGDMTAATRLEARLTEDSNARSMRPDGNSVQIDSELLQMNRNMVEHDFLSEVISRNIKQLRLAITGRAG